MPVYNKRGILLLPKVIVLNPKDGYYDYIVTLLTILVALRQHAKPILNDISICRYVFLSFGVELKK